MNSNVKLISGILAGATAGALIGILTAPDSGENTRKKIKKETNKFKKDLDNRVNETLEAVKTSINNGVDELSANLKSANFKTHKELKNATDKAKASVS